MKLPFSKFEIIENSKHICIHFIYSLVFFLLFTLLIENQKLMNTSIDKEEY